MFTKEERLFIWKKVYEMIDWQEDGEYICVALRNVVFMYFKKHIMFCKDCIFFNNSERCSLSESQDWCLKKQVVYCKIRHDGGI